MFPILIFTKIRKGKFARCHFVDFCYRFSGPNKVGELLKRVPCIGRKDNSKTDKIFSLLNTQY